MKCFKAEFFKKLNVSLRLAEAACAVECKLLRFSWRHRESLTMLISFSIWKKQLKWSWSCLKWGWELETLLRTADLVLQVALAVGGQEVQLVEWRLWLSAVTWLGVCHVTNTYHDKLSFAAGPRATAAELGSSLLCAVRGEAGRMPEMTDQLAVFKKWIGENALSRQRRLYHSSSHVFSTAGLFATAYLLLLFNFWRDSVFHLSWITLKEIHFPCI